MSEQPAIASTSGPRVMPLRITFSWTLLGYFAYAGCQWGIIVSLAKLGTPEMVGQYALGLTITAPIVLFCSLQLRSLQVTDTTGHYGFADYLGLRAATSLIAVALIAAIVAAGDFSPRTAWVVIATGLVKAIDAVADTYAGLFQQHDRMDRVAVSQTLRGAAAIAALVAIVATTHDLLIGIVAMAITSAVVLVLYDIPNSRSVGVVADGTGRSEAAVRPRWRLPVITALIRTGLPLGVLILLLSLNSNVPSYVVGRILGQAPLGVFAALAFLTLVIPTVVNALGQAASRRLARCYFDGDRWGFLRLTFRLLLIALALALAATLAAALAGRPLLALFYTPEYAAQQPLFVLLMAGAVLACVASVLGVALTATRCFAPQVPLGLIVTGLALGTCLWLVPLLGLHGAAWAVILSSAVQSGGLALLLMRRVARLPTASAGARRVERPDTSIGRTSGSGSERSGQAVDGTRGC